MVTVRGKSWRRTSRLELLIGSTHHPSSVDAAKSHHDPVAGRLFEAFRDLIADEQFTGRLLLL
jgi:hypothetical protein